MRETNKKTGSANSLQAGYGVPIAIVTAGLLIAGAVFWSGGNASEANRQQVNKGQAPTSEPSGEFRLPNESDHVRGSGDAKVTIIEYSDFNCLFCARIHPTLSRIVEEYDGEVNWVYRHFANYAQGKVAAIGAECAAQLGGNDIFWEFADKMFDNQRKLGDNLSIETVISLGIDEGEFRACLGNSREIEAKMTEHRNEAIFLGGRGTPFVVIVSASEKLIPFSGALPYEQIKSLVEQARNN